MKSRKQELGNGSQPIYIRLREWMIAHIDTFPPGAKLPTEFELADRFDISRLTVHKVINQLQTDGYVTRIRSKGTFVARKDQRILERGAGKNGTVIVAYADWFSYDIWAKVEMSEIQAVKHGFNLVNVKLTRLGGYSLLESLIDEFDDVRGVVVIPPGGLVAESEKAHLDSLGVPVAILAEVESVEKTAHLFTVSQDMATIAHLDVATAIAQNVRKLAHIGAEPHNLQMVAFSRALKREAANRVELVVSGLPSRAWSDTPAKAYQMTAEMIDKHPDLDALIFDSFPTALAASRALYDARHPDMMLLVNAPYFGFERFLQPRAFLVYSSIKDIVATAFSMIGADVVPLKKRSRLIKAHVETSNPKDGHFCV